LRVVDVLEQRYPDFNGLNLTREVRSGIIRHSSPFDLKRAGTADIQCPRLLEIGVVDISDEIAYDNHDLDDGLKSGLMDERDLEGVPIWDEAVSEVERRFGSVSPEIKKSQIVRHLINIQVSDIIASTLKGIEDQRVNSIADLNKQKGRMVDFSDEMNAKRVRFKEILNEKLYRNYRVIRMSNKASRFLRQLFQVYSDNPDQLPPQSRDRIEERGKHRVICDYIAGMTDRYALDQYKKFFEPFERV
jgi:dGTPase